MQKPSAQELPANADLLARLYIDAIAAAENVAVNSMFKSNKDDVFDEFLQGLETTDEADSPHVRVDLLLAAVLGARMISTEPDLAHRLRHQGPVVVVKSHTSELVDQLSDSTLASVPRRQNRFLPAADQAAQGRGPFVLHSDPKQPIPALAGTSADHNELVGMS